MPETLPTRDPAVVAIAAALADPFDPKDVKFKPQMVKGNRALAMGYIDARLIQDRLDEVLGVENWQDRYEFLPDGSVVCTLRLFIGGRWVAKTDVGSPSEQPDGGDRVKASVSDALKRAAVKFGIGRYLYRLPAQWVDYDPVKKQLVQLPQLPPFALPGRKAKPAPANGTPPKPAGGQHAAPPSETRDALRDELRVAMQAAGVDWPAAMRWLSAAYPSEPVQYTHATRFGDIEQERVAHLVRHLRNTAARKES